jgi:hypothetical protein
VGGPPSLFAHSTKVAGDTGLSIKNQDYVGPAGNSSDLSG